MGQSDLFALQNELALSEAEEYLRKPSGCITNLKKQTNSICKDRQQRLFQVITLLFSPEVYFVLNS